MLIGVGSVALHWTTIAGELKNDPALAPFFDIAVGVVAIFLVFGFALSLLLWYRISRRASNGAKWIYVVVTGFGVVSTLMSINDPESPTDAALAISLASTAFAAGSIFFLFRPDARTWFARKTVDPRAFD